MDFALAPRAAAAGYRVLSFDSIGSTNDEGLARSRQGERGPLWIAARAQSAGRGRRGTRWLSPQGNLAASLLTFSARPLMCAATLGFVAGLALDAALSACAPALQSRLALKWPNDVLADGKKLAGILLESERVENGHAVVVGIGVNVVSAPCDLPAVSLGALSVDIHSEEVFTELSGAWLDYVRIWDEGRGLPAVRSHWLARAASVGTEITVRVGGKALRGTFETLDEQGRLILRLPDREAMAIAAGEVYFGPLEAEAR
jgi:BirA family transcriptional regulator, biotin operon repressor / biotin---[acetyl-CoA-carboxylase] ligase